MTASNFNQQQALAAYVDVRVCKPAPQFPLYFHFVLFRFRWPFTNIKTTSKRATFSRSSVYKNKKVVFPLVFSLTCMCMYTCTLVACTFVAFWKISEISKIHERFNGFDCKLAERLCEKFNLFAYQTQEVEYEILYCFCEGSALTKT